LTNQMEDTGRHAFVGADLLPLAPAILQALESIQSSQTVAVPFSG